MFIRLVSSDKRREILLNVNHISMIEVLYGVPDGSGMCWQTSFRAAAEDPTAQRWYRVRLGTVTNGHEDLVTLAANPDDPVAKVFDDIRKAAIG